jgi:hypothetical protein
MERAVSDDMRHVHVESLQQWRGFSRVYIIRDGGKETITVEKICEGVLYSLVVTLEPNFPLSPPIITSTWGRPINFAKQGKPRWDHEVDLLPEVVETAFQNFIDLCGGVHPPDVRSMAALLSTMPSEIARQVESQQDFAENFAPQLPIAKAIASATTETLDNLEALANLVTERRHRLDVEREKITNAKSDYEEKCKSVRKLMEGLPPLEVFATPEGLTRLIASEAKAIRVAAEEVEREWLAIEQCNSRSAFMRKQEEYLEKMREYHKLDLKRRAFMTAAGKGC